MLGKLFKHEFQRTSKIGGLLLIIAACVTILGAIYLVSPLFHGMLAPDDMRNPMIPIVGAILGFLGLLSYSGMLIGLSVGFMIYLGFRFYKSMYSDEGYLTHTLPVKSSDILIAKVVTGGVWMLIMTIAMTLMVAFLMLLGFAEVRGVSIGTIIISIKDTLEIFFGYIKEFTGMKLTSSGIMLILMFFITPFANISILYGAITLGQYSWKNKGLMGIIAYLGIRMLMSIVSGILNLGMTVGRMSGEIDAGISLSLANDKYFTTLLVSVLFAVVLFVWSIHVVKDRLNLE
jgi:hypothetical protein